MRTTYDSKGITDFALYAIGVLVVALGAAVCYALALLGVAASGPDAALVMTIVSVVGFILVIAGVTLRVRRRGREVIGPLLFGIGLLVALSGSLVIYTLVLYQAISEESALLGITSVTVSATILTNVGVAYRAYRIEEKESRRVVMKPLRRLYPRRAEEDQDGRDG